MDRKNLMSSFYFSEVGDQLARNGIEITTYLNSYNELFIKFGDEKPIEVNHIDYDKLLNYIKSIKPLIRWDTRPYYWAKTKPRFKDRITDRLNYLIMGYPIRGAHCFEGGGLVIDNKIYIEGLEDLRGLKKAIEQ